MGNTKTELSHAEGVTIAIPQMGNSLFRKYMKSKYAKSLERSGAVTRWIELEDVDEAVRRTLECDGLLLPGGADIAPELYGQTPDPKTGKPNQIRDGAEPRILEAFLATGRPILGICRGIQMINVYFKGTLHQDIKDSQTFRHMDFFSRAHTTHPVTIRPDTLLAGCLGSTQLDVNSMHHQAIDRVGEGLIATAATPDGFVEGIELSGHPFCLGVQWHPEHMSARYPAQQQLFDCFVKACEEQKL